MNKKPDVNLDFFEKWHSIVNDNIQDFFVHIPEHVREKLDYSTTSLDVLGAWLVEEAEKGQRQIHRGATYYVGEVYRKELEGHWNVHFKALEPDFEFGEEPVIEGFHHDVAICPYLEVLVTIKDRKSTRLSGILSTFMKMYRSNRYKSD